jgi:hypothetical protein
VCSDRYSEYMQETVNRRPVHERIGRMHPNDDRRQKIVEVIDHPRKGKLTRDGLIKKRTSAITYGSKDSGARLA